MTKTKQLVSGAKVFYLRSETSGGTCCSFRLVCAAATEADNVASTDAIADVSETLVTLLREEVSSSVTVVLGSPADFDPSQAGLSVFLFDVDLNTHLMNERDPPSVESVQPGEPLPLELSYLITAHPSPQDEAHEQTPSRIDYHKELGEAMRVLWDNRIISGSELKGSLGSADRLHVTIGNRSFDEILDVWNTFQETPYLPSITIAVTPVIIESDRETTVTRVEQAKFKHEQGTE